MRKRILNAKRSLVLFAMMVVLACSSSAFAAATIVIVNLDGAGEGFNDPTPAAPVGGNTGTTLGEQRLIAFQHAADIWGSTLDSNVIIRIRAAFNPLAANVLGSAGAISAVRDFPSNGAYPGAEFPATWYGVALANKRAGLDLIPANDDINAQFNSNFNFYLGLDNLHGPLNDLVVVLLHEFGHGLNFQTFVNASTGANLGITPATPDGFTDIFARHLLDTTIGLHWHEMTQAQRQAASVKFGRIVWDGATVTANVPNVLVFGSPNVSVNSPAAIAGTYQFGTASFGPPLGSPNVTADVVAAEDPADAAGPATTDGCSAFTNAAAVAGKIALIERGTCTFALKARNATNAGASAFIIYNNAANAALGPPNLGDDGINGQFVLIPGIGLSRTDGLAIVGQLGGGVNASLISDPTVRAGADALGRARLFAPAPVQGGSSISHYDSVARRNLLMEPAINGDLTHNVQSPDDLTLELFRDVGWFPDADVDGAADGVDNCVTTPNGDQLNSDGDAFGDACDNCPFTANTDQANNDGDALGDACDPDDDNDTVPDGVDNCPFIANTDQADADLDNIGDACEAGTQVFPTMYGGNGGHGNPNPSINDGSLVIVDQGTAAVTLVGHPLGIARLTGIAFDATGKLYASTITGGGFPPPPSSPLTSTLVRLNPDTGALLQTIGPITNGAGGPAIAIADLAIQPSTGTLFGIRAPVDQGGGQGRLYTIDKATGVATLVGNTNARFASIAFHPNGTLYETAADFAAGTQINFRLITINPSNGAVLTSVPTARFYGALGIRPNDGVVFAGSGDQHDIYTLNPTTGAETIIGDTGQNFVGDLDFKPTQSLLQGFYKQTNLVSDIPGFAQIQDPRLVNPWGISMSTTSPFWTANNGTSTATLYAGDVNGSPFTKNSLNVTIPGDLPTGTVFNASSDFAFTAGGTTGPARFIFASITGNITAWKGGTSATIVATQAGHVYTGLAIGSNSGGNRLYAADFASGNIDVYDASYALTTVTGGFLDASIPQVAGNTYHPFNIQNIAGQLYVAYAKVGADGLDEEGIGNGFVRRFNTDGARDITFGLDNGPLNSPWGVAIAPASFGVFSNALLVGNFGDGTINAFNSTTGAFLGTVNDQAGNPLEIEGLWAVTFGNGGSGGDLNTLYFAAGYDHENHGLFGSIKPAASASTLIQFSSSTYSVSETAGSVDITVTRAGDLSVPSTVNYATLNGTATQGSDYILAAGTINFGVGETSKTFSVFVTDDVLVESSETVSLVLSNPTGASLGTPNQAPLTITDNDSPSISPSQRTFVATMNGAQEVPANASNGRGTGLVILDPGGASAKVSFAFAGLGSPANAAHIHGPAAPGTNAPILFPFSGVPAATSGSVNNITITLTPTQLQQLKDGLFYFNVHTTNIPGGEIRGQILFNPIDESSFFVTEHYFDFLNRAPDALGLAFWTNEIEKCLVDTRCFSDRRVGVSAAFFFEQEFQQTGSFVYRVRRASLGTQPQYGEYIIDKSLLGAGSDADKTAFAEAFTQRPEFLVKYPTTQNGSAFIDALIASINSASGVNLAARRPELVIEYLLGTSQTQSRARVIRKAIEYPEYVTAEFNPSFVLAEYFGYLRRDPDPGGYSFWLNVLNNNVPGNFRTMVCAFLTSAEYQQRFGGAITRNDKECADVGP